MTGTLLMLLTAAASLGLGGLAFASLLSRRVRIPVRTMPRGFIRTRS